MELVWKYGRLSSIPFSKFSIPFHSGIFYIPYRNFRSIPFHFIPSPGCRFYIIIATFYPNGCSQFQILQIWKRLILKKVLLLLAHFQHFRFRVYFRFQPLPSKCFWFRFHKKLIASASTSLVVVMDPIIWSQFLLKVWYRIWQNGVSTVLIDYSSISEFLFRIFRLVYVLLLPLI